jgi:hypothetical protein
VAKLTAEVIVVTELLLDVESRKVTEKLFLVLYVKQSREISHTNEHINI